ncbi:unnamed protein product [Candidula unifasciata]|uniref:Uncharacterized protein n=1 Tax=Candidula unifasciata TaxID=100452 RepID=A0A8S3Z1Z1_9EUPU|nr:unnamed protein product [Candidula unifasciata]
MDSRLVQRKSAAEMSLVELSRTSLNIVPYVARSVTLQNLVRLGVNLSKVQKVAGVAEYLIKADFQQHIVPQLQFLALVGVEANFVGHIYTANPLLFLESVEDLELRVGYLVHKNFSLREVAALVTKDPIVLLMDPVVLDEKLAFLQNLFDLTDSMFVLSHLTLFTLWDWMFVLSHLTLFTLWDWMFVLSHLTLFTLWDWMFVLSHLTLFTLWDWMFVLSILLYPVRLDVCPFTSYFIYSDMKFHMHEFMGFSNTEIQQLLLLSPKVFFEGQSLSLSPVSILTAVSNSLTPVSILTVVSSSLSPVSILTAVSSSLSPVSILTAVFNSLTPVSILTVVSNSLTP